MAPASPVIAGLARSHAGDAYYCAPAHARKGLEIEEVSLLRFLQALQRQNDH
ncbi:hypothetical protein HU751_022255 [Pseudomonas sp. BW13M1]|uniref:Uncharacterized protein n=1 Tax=Pseudomonas peradeniyensis TaxID=2745488 RepID=A0A923K2N6_9PSED|nr:hypothetical protein [Pseudomonas peradeniyensis]MBV4507561.1 hypothetical protein [Pseudomonas peradeniyensis]